MISQRHGLAQRVSDYILHSLTGATHEAFDTLAMDIHAFQRAHDPVVASLINGAVNHWTEIPAVPVALFKALPVGTLGEDEPCVVFKTSGTTGGGRGEHRLRDTLLYDLGSLAWARRCVPQAPLNVVALLLDPSVAPSSSLSHMVAMFGEVSWHLSETGVATDEADRRIREAIGPVYLCATAFALAEWLATHPPPLPADSVVMITGGFKGRVHRLDQHTLYGRTQQKLRPARLVTEYGMTELSSQLWGTPGGPYYPPPWLRVRAINPHTGRTTDGPGQLVFTDLCNLDSTLSVETLDRGTVNTDGSVSLMGRLTDAPSRGCSLTVEEAWARR